MGVESVPWSVKPGFWVRSYSGLLSMDIRVVPRQPATIRHVIGRVTGSFRLRALGPTLGDAV